MMDSGLTCTSRRIGSLMGAPQFLFQLIHHPDENPIQSLNLVYFGF